MPKQKDDEQLEQDVVVPQANKEREAIGEDSEVSRETIGSPNEIRKGDEVDEVIIELDEEDELDTDSVEPDDEPAERDLNKR